MSTTLTCMTLIREASVRTQHNVLQYVIQHILIAYFDSFKSHPRSLYPQCSCHDIHVCWCSSSKLRS